MPISRTQFDQVRDETRYYLFQFLKDRLEEAFTVDELVNHLKAEGVINDGSCGDTGRLLTAGALLDEMVRASLVEKKIIAGQAYFSFNAARKGHTLARLASSLWVFY